MNYTQHMIFAIMMSGVMLLWALGLLAAHARGGFIHVLLVLPIIIALIRLVRGNPTA